jgi:hypothetical protein
MNKYIKKQKVYFEQRNSLIGEFDIKKSLISFLYLIAQI